MQEWPISACRLLLLQRLFLLVSVCVCARKCKNSTTHLSGFHKKHMACTHCTHNNTRMHSIDSPLYNSMCIHTNNFVLIFEWNYNNNGNSSSREKKSTTHRAMNDNKSSSSKTSAPDNRLAKEHARKWERVRCGSGTETDRVKNWLNNRIELMYEAHTVRCVFVVTTDFHW